VSDPERSARTRAVLVLLLVVVSLGNAVSGELF